MSDQAGGKSSNVGASGSFQPADYSVERKVKYVAWTRTVIALLPYKPEIALQAFNSHCEAKLSVISHL